MNIQKTVIILLSLALSLSTLAAPGIIGSGFSYQGQLQDNGSPANADYDVKIDAYRYPTIDPLLSSLEFTDVSVSNGLFTIPVVDFGDAIYNGEEIWLEVSVKLAGAATYTVLTPRQRVAAVPYAVQADYLGPIGANNGDILKFNAGNWEPSDPVDIGQWDENGSSLTHIGNVGIGANDPLDRLVINADVGQNALRVKVNEQTKLRVRAGGGTVLGTNTTDAPVDGLYVHGDVKQNETSNGMLKYMLTAECDAFPTILREYNGTTAVGTAAITRPSVGLCNIALPFDTSSSYISVNLLNDVTGVNKTGNCVASAISVNCKFEESSTGTNSDVFFTLLVY